MGSPDLTICQNATAQKCNNISNVGPDVMLFTVSCLKKPVDVEYVTKVGQNKSWTLFLYIR